MNLDIPFARHKIAIRASGEQPDSQADIWPVLDHVAVAVDDGQPGGFAVAGGGGEAAVRGGGEAAVRGGGERGVLQFGRWRGCGVAGRA